MVLSEQMWRELIDLGVLEGDETCNLCREQPRILLDAARAPVLLCPAHAQLLAEQLLTDLKYIATSDITP